MKSPHGAHLLTALPFLLVFTADEVSISTHIEDDATGVRSIKVVAKPQAKTTLDERKINALLPHSPMRRLRTRDATDSYRVTGNIRFTQPDVIGNLHVERHVRLRPWPVFQAVYTYTDKITRTDFPERERDVAAASKTEFTYSVTMPGEIDANSIHPPGGIPQGRTVTWKLKADKATQDIAVTAMRPDWPPMIFVALLIVLGILSLARVLRRRERTTPRRI